MTKQGPSVRLTALPETPGIYLHEVCLGTGEIGTAARFRGWQQFLCSTSFPCLSPDVVASRGEVTEGLAPSTALGRSPCPWGTGKKTRQGRDSPQHKGTQGHIQTGRRGRGVRTETQIRPLQTQVSLANAAMTEPLLSLSPSHATVA